MHSHEIETNGFSDNSNPELNIFSIAEMIVKGVEILNDETIKDSKGVEIFRDVIEPYKGHFTIEEVRSVLVMASRRKILTETHMKDLSGPFVMSTIEGWNYFTNNKHKAFLSAQEFFKRTVTASTPLEDVRGMEVIKRGLRNLVNRWGNPHQTL